MMSSETFLQLGSTFNCDLLVAPLQTDFGSLKSGLAVRVSPPSGLAEQLLLPSGDAECSIGTVIILRVEDWLRESTERLVGPGTDALARQVIREKMDEFLPHLSVLAMRGRPVWLMLCPSNGYVARQHNLVTLCRTLGNLLLVRIKNLKRVQLLATPGELSSDAIWTIVGDQESQSPLTSRAAELLARSVAEQVIQSISAQSPLSADNVAGSPELARFLAGLKVEITVAPASSDDAHDIGHVLRSAASFTLTGEQPTMPDSEVEAVCISGECHIVRVTDRLSDYGTAGVIVARPTADCLVVETMSLSCPVLGKQVEFALLEALVNLAQRHNLETVVFGFRDSGRNQPALAFLRNVIGTDSESAFRLALSEVPASINRAAISPGAWSLRIG